LPVRLSFILAAAISLALAGCTAGAPSTPAAPTPTAPAAPTPVPPEPTPVPPEPTPTAPAGETEPPAGTSAEVSIAGFAFDPASLSVTVGTQITWTNEDSTPHTVTFSDGPDSGSLDQGETFQHTFDTAGTYDYICTIHPTMQGSVEVTD
jgi:plastocyanin